MEDQFASSVRSGRAEEVGILLRDNPSLDVNQFDIRGVSALHAASMNGFTSVVKLLLAHPAINVNLQNGSGSTSLVVSCVYGVVEVVQLLLKDPRVDINLPSDNDCNPPLEGCLQWSQ